MFFDISTSAPMFLVPESLFVALCMSCSRYFKDSGGAWTLVMTYNTTQSAN